MSANRLSDVLDAIYAEGKLQGFSKAEVARRAGMHPSSVSRMVNAGNARFDKLDTLAAAVGMKLHVVVDNRVAQGLADGNLF